MTFAVAEKVIGVVITSSPGPMPAAIRARCMPAVQELRPTACFAPMASRELRLEALRLRAVGHPAGAQRVDDLGDLFFADFWLGDRNELV